LSQQITGNKSLRKPCIGLQRGYFVLLSYMITLLKTDNRLQ